VSVFCMPFSIIPCFKIFNAVTNKCVSGEGIKAARDAYNFAVFLRTKCGAKIVLPKLINDKIKKNMNGRQKVHFYTLVSLDNSTSGEAGRRYDNCLASTAKAVSYENYVVIVAVDSVPNLETIKDNKKILVMTPAEFIDRVKAGMEMKNSIYRDMSLSECISITFFSLDAVLPQIKKIMCDKEKSEETSQGSASGKIKKTPA